MSYSGFNKCVLNFHPGHGIKGKAVFYVIVLHGLGGNLISRLFRLRFIDVSSAPCSVCRGHGNHHSLSAYKSMCGWLGAKQLDEVFVHAVAEPFPSRSFSDEKDVAVSSDSWNLVQVFRS